MGPGGSSVPEGQALISGILDACFEVAQDIKAREAVDEVSANLKPIFDRLTEIKAQLERLREYRDYRTAQSLIGSFDTSMDASGD